MERLRVAAIGDMGSIIGFRGMMMETLAVRNAEEARAQLEQALHNGEYAILYVTRAVAEASPELMAESRSMTLPAVIVLPDPGAPKGSGSHALREAAKKAIGFDILKDDADFEVDDLKLDAAIDNGLDVVDEENGQGEQSEASS